MNHYYVTPLDPGAGGYYQRSPASGLYRPGYAIIVPRYQAFRQPLHQPAYVEETYEEQPAAEPPPPRASNEPIVKPKIIVPPPRREY
jgi:hypothetical protein